jgi:hypothetical protein
MLQELTMHLVSIPYRLVRKVPQQAWVAVGSISIVGSCAYPVYNSSTRPGHELFSSEKPEAVREAQDAKRKEYRRLVKEQRSKLTEERATLAEAKNQA